MYLAHGIEFYGIACILKPWNMTALGNETSTTPLDQIGKNVHRRHQMVSILVSLAKNSFKAISQVWKIGIFVILSLCMGK